MCHSKEYREDKIPEAEIELPEEEIKQDESNPHLAKPKEDYRDG